MTNYSTVSSRDGQSSSIAAHRTPVTVQGGFAGQLNPSDELGGLTHLSDSLTGRRMRMDESELEHTTF